MRSMSGHELGAFLRARRSQVTPADVGLPTSGSRRVAGLRREEVAVLAGVSADYYARLEQGRETNPSGQVIDAIAGALRLGLDARWHAYRLAGLLPKSAPAHPHDQVHPALLQLMDAFPTAVAYVINRRLDVLASNALADIPSRSLTAWRRTRGCPGLEAEAPALGTIHAERSGRCAAVGPSTATPHRTAPTDGSILGDLRPHQYRRRRPPVLPGHPGGSRAQAVEQFAPASRA
ncbi:helix-turn-helix domain-containing protein [Kitasatospora sp. NPDC086801]|uniref:helix-turn-helix domain-containing protein n=1 Tax=Kitasatospora sp. NPDC086801 TaxID=3364066 RepID=UPI0038099C3F